MDSYGSTDYTQRLLNLHIGKVQHSPERKAEVWRETKVLPPLCKGQQLSPMDFPDGHWGDQARDGLVCNQGLARREDQKFADRQAKTECWWGRWIQTPVKNTRKDKLCENHESSDTG